jgi:GT2 family glycosyltransferase
MNTSGVNMRHVAGARAPADSPYDADIVILALDRPAETEAAILSALSQTGISRHVTVLDQGSAPPARDRLAATIAGRMDATLLAVDRNLGVGGGRNRATAFGHGRVIAALDNDAEFATSTTVAAMVAALDADTALGAVACRIVLYATGQDDPTSWGYPRALLARSAGTFDTATFVGAGHAIARRAWTEAGGYDEALFFCWEEFDFCLRAIALGWGIRYHGDIAVRHKVSPEQRLAWSGTRWFHFVRNRIYIERKYCRTRLGATPRALGYLLKGWCNGRLRETIAAIAAAERLATAGPRVALPGHVDDYLECHDTNWRGSWWTRLRHEVLVDLR